MNACSDKHKSNVCGRDGKLHRFAYFASADQAKNPCWRVPTKCIGHLFSRVTHVRTTCFWFSSRFGIDGPAEVKSGEMPPSESAAISHASTGPAIRRSVALADRANWAWAGPFLQKGRWMILRPASAAPGPAPNYEGDDRTDHDNSAAIAKIRIDFQIPPSSPSSGGMSPASCFSVQMSISDTLVTVPLRAGALRFSVFNPRQLLPVPNSPLKPMFRDPKHRDDIRFDCSAVFRGSIGTTSKFPLRTVGGERQRDHDPLGLARARSFFTIG